MAGLGIVLATVIGFIVGISRLSTNWLVARLAAVYVEVIRNVPLLLQLFFWYFAVLKSLPVPRQSHVLPAGGFLNVRGLYLPAPVPEPGFGTVALASYGAVANRRAFLARAPAANRPAALSGAVDLPGAHRLAPLGVFPSWAPLGFEIPISMASTPGRDCAAVRRSAAGLSIYTELMPISTCRIMVVSKGQMRRRWRSVVEGAIAAHRRIPPAMRISPAPDDHSCPAKNSRWACPSPPRSRLDGRARCSTRPPA